MQHWEGNLYITENRVKLCVADKSQYVSHSNYSIIKIIIDDYYVQRLFRSTISLSSFLVTYQSFAKIALIFKYSKQKALFLKYNWKLINQRLLSY